MPPAPLPSRQATTSPAETARAAELLRAFTMTGKADLMPTDRAAAAP